MREGRSKKWKRMKKVTNDLKSRRRQVYMDSQRMVLLEKDSERCFFKNIKSYGSKEKPKAFDVQDVLIGLTGAECAEKLADHFNAISNESTFRPCRYPCHERRRAGTPDAIPGGRKAEGFPKVEVHGGGGHFSIAGDSVCGLPCPSPHGHLQRGCEVSYMAGGLETGICECYTEVFPPCLTQ